MTYQQHPLSAAFPAMTDEERQELEDSIEAIGVQNPITIFEGMVLDGWHRYDIANGLMVECPSVELPEWTDPRQFVIAQNRARRHITTAQRLLAYTAVYDWVSTGFNQYQERGRTECHPSKTNAEIAAEVGASERYVRHAKVVLTKAAPEVLEAARRGDVGLKKASEICKLPADQQAEAMTKPLCSKQRQEFDSPVRTRTETPAGGTEVYESSAQSEAADLKSAADATPDFESGAYGPSAGELAAEAAAVEADMKAIQALLDSDDKLATAHAEIKRLNLQVAQMQQRIHGLMGEKAEAISRWKGLERQLNKLKKVAA
jgi:hypothetical protein